MSDPDDKLVYKRPEGVDLDILENAFRETFISLLYQDDSDFITLRAFGRLLNNFAAEARGSWPYRYIDGTVNSLRAGTGDLRHLQDFFTNWGEEEPESEEEPEEELQRHRELQRLSMRTAQVLKKLADEIEEEIRDWEFQPRR